MKIFFFYGDEVKIKIEISNSFIDFFEVFPILNFFKKIHITHENKPKLIVPKDINSNIQIVGNYLKYINQINQKDIIFNKSNQINSSNSIIAKPLSQEECQNLILNKFGWRTVDSFFKFNIFKYNSTK